MKSSTRVDASKTQVDEVVDLVVRTATSAKAEEDLQRKQLELEMAEELVAIDLLKAAQMMNYVMEFVPLPGMTTDFFASLAPAAVAAVAPQLPEV